MNFNKTYATPLWDQLLARELYDTFAENVNVVDDPAMQGVVKRMSALLRAGWRGAAGPVRLT